MIARLSTRSTRLITEALSSGNTSGNPGPGAATTTQHAAPALCATPYSFSNEVSNAARAAPSSSNSRLSIITTTTAGRSFRCFANHVLLRIPLSDAGRSAVVTIPSSPLSRPDVDSLVPKRAAPSPVPPSPPTAAAPGVTVCRSASLIPRFRDRCFSASDASARVSREDIPNGGLSCFKTRASSSCKSGRPSASASPSGGARSSSSRIAVHRRSSNASGGRRSRA